LKRWFLFANAQAPGAEEMPRVRLDYEQKEASKKNFDVSKPVAKYEAIIAEDLQFMILCQRHDLADLFLAVSFD